LIQTKKTRLFVTNSMNYLPSTDQIIYIENGTIEEMNSYNKLVELNGLFSEFIKSYFQNKQTNIDDLSN
jgi:ABC-type transport system involved in cytochrome bd biosynthesis fused ATPase/permease subunit